MTLRARFNLIALCLTLPPALALAGYFLFAWTDFSDPTQIAADAGARDWAGRALAGAEEHFAELSPGIAALAVRRGDGVVVFSNARGLQKGENVGPGQLLERVASAYPGADYVAESAAGGPGGSYVAVVKPEAGPWYARPYLIGTASLLALECLIVTIGIVLMLRTSASLRGLSEAARRIAGGDLAFTLAGKGGDEVTLLYRAFDDMRRELAEARDARSRFLMGVSHDLRTPLTSLKGYLQALADGLAEDPAERDKFLGILRAKADLLESRLQELIEFAGLETAVWRAKLVDLKLRDFLGEIARAAAADAEVSSRKFTSRLHIAPETVVRADPHLFLRVLENLLSNALRYTRPGDTVALEADEDDERYSIVVRDDGPGIPAEDRKRVFEEFYRGTHARNEEGLGLGLSIVRSVVSAHGWQVRLSEDAVAGASFVISIPKPPAP